MARPRITISETKNGFLEIWMNPEGRELLIKQLMKLGGNNDHLHFGIGMDIEASPIPYRDDDTVIEWAKIYLRPDDWDEKYFPHVMKAMPSE